MSYSNASRAFYAWFIVLTVIVLFSSSSTFAADEQPEVAELRVTIPWIEKIELTKLGDHYEYFVVDAEGNEFTLNPKEFSRLVHERQYNQKWWHKLLNTTQWQGILWVSLGFVGQFLFTGRMLIQWIVSERKKQSVIPTIFWWLSLGGASMLLIYFIWRKDIIGVIGQTTGWIVYLRNLAFIYLKRYQQTA